jgi:hypothetical protein
MARTANSGLDYYPFDTDFFSDIKIRKLIRRQGGKAITVYACVLCFIYKNGYYIGADNELAFIISEQTGCEEAYIRQVLECCFSLGLFDMELYDTEKIITSKGIQERYSKICSLTKKRTGISEYNLITSERKPIITETKPIITEVMQQRKEKGNKEEVSSDTSLSGGKPPDCPPANTPPDSIDFKKLVDWFNAKTSGIFGVIRLPLGENRKKMLRARIGQFGKKSFAEVVENAIDSKFLCGQNNRGWTATFDWLLKPSNYEKILSGNYKNKEDETHQGFSANGSKSDSVEQFMSAVRSGIARSEYDKAQREGGNFD